MSRTSLHRRIAFAFAFLTGSACSSNDGPGGAAGGAAATGGAPSATGGAPSAMGGARSYTGGIVDDLFGGGPSVLAICGDGRRDPTERCEDHNTTEGDGCDPSCTPEPGWNCDSAPGCIRIWGNQSCAPEGACDFGGGCADVSTGAACRCPPGGLPACNGLAFLSLDLPDDASDCTASGVNSDGSLVVGDCARRPSLDLYGPEALHAMKWSLPGSGEALELPADRFTTATAISADSRVVLGIDRSSTNSLDRRAYRLSEDGLEYLPAGVWVTAMSADGSVMVGQHLAEVGSATLARAFRWTQATGLVDLGALGADEESAAFGVSGDGSVVVGASGFDAFRWTEDSGMATLPLPAGAAAGSAYAASEDGAVIVGDAAFDLNGNDSHAVRWQGAAEPEDLGALPGTTITSATLVSADGALIVGASNGFDGPMVWDASHGMRTLPSILSGVDFSHWYNLQVNGLSADGHVLVGSGEYVPEGAPRSLASGFIAWLP